MHTIVIAFIRIYQAFTPLLNSVLVSVFGFSSACPQHPTCSNYTIHQIQKHGTIAGIRKGLHRITHCYALPKV